MNHFRPFYRYEDWIVLGFKPTYSCSPTEILVAKRNALYQFTEDIGQLQQIAEGLTEVDAYARHKIRLALFVPHGAIDH